MLEEVLQAGDVWFCSKRILEGSISPRKKKAAAANNNKTFSYECICSETLHIKNQKQTNTKALCTIKIPNNNENKDVLFSVPYFHLNKIFKLQIHMFLQALDNYSVGSFDPFIFFR